MDKVEYVKEKLIDKLRDVLQKGKDAGEDFINCAVVIEELMETHCTKVADALYQFGQEHPELFKEAK